MNTLDTAWNPRRTGTAAHQPNGQQVNGPRVMCVACEQVELHSHDIVCLQCRNTLEHAGILAPQSPCQPTHQPTAQPEAPKVQIGPLDI